MCLEWTNRDVLGCGLKLSVLELLIVLLNSGIAGE